MEGQTPIQKPQIEVAQLKCALCKKSGHSAAWRSCEVRIQQEKLHLEKQRGRQNAQRRNKVPPPDFNCREQFPNTLRATNVHPLQTAYHVYQPAPARPAASERKPRSKPRLIPMEECLDIFDTFVNELMQCTSAEQQVRTIARLAIQQVQKYLTPTYD